MRDLDTVRLTPPNFPADSRANLNSLDWSQRRELGRHPVIEIGCTRSVDDCDAQCERYTGRRAIQSCGMPRQAGDFQPRFGRGPLAEIPSRMPQSLPFTSIPELVFWDTSGSSQGHSYRFLARQPPFLQESLGSIRGYVFQHFLLIKIPGRPEPENMLMWTESHFEGSLRILGWLRGVDGRRVRKGNPHLSLGS